MNDIPSPGFNPHGSREQIYREHEHIFAGYMRTYPKSFEVQCGEMVPESLASRLRKIAKDLMHYGWETKFPIADFRAAWGQTAIRVSMARTVVIGPKKGKIEAAATPVKRAGQALLTVRELGPDPRKTLMTLAYLHHEKVIDGGATHIQGLPEDVALEFAAMLDAQPQGNRKWAVDFRRHPSQPGWLLY